MTRVGKALVVTIMVFAFVFLSLSIVVLTTTKDWNAEAQDLTKKITALKADISARDGALKTQVNNLKTTKDEFTKQENQFKAQIAALETDQKNRAAELEQTRSTVESRQQTAKTTLAEAEQQKKETDSLKAILSQVQEQSNAFSRRQTELNDEIRIMKRQLDTVSANNKDLKERTQ